MQPLAERISLLRTIDINHYQNKQIVTIHSSKEENYCGENRGQARLQYLGDQNSYPKIYFRK